MKEVHYFDGGIEEGTDTYALGERWYRGHFPRESLLVLRAEDLFEDPAGLMGGLCDFLGLDRPAGGGDFRPANVGTNREAVDAGVRAELDAYFAPMNRALSAALGRDFGWEG